MYTLPWDFILSPPHSSSINRKLVWLKIRRRIVDYKWCLHQIRKSTEKASFWKTKCHICHVQLWQGWKGQRGKWGGCSSRSAGEAESRGRRGAPASLTAPLSFNFVSFHFNPDSSQLLSSSGTTLPVQNQGQNSSLMQPLLDQPMGQAPSAMHSDLQNTLHAQMQSSLENAMQSNAQSSLQVSIEANLPTPMQTQMESSLQNQMQASISATSSMDKIEDILESLQKQWELVRLLGNWAGWLKCS